MSDFIRDMNSVLGNKYHILASGSSDPVVLAKLPDEDLDENPNGLSGSKRPVGFRRNDNEMTEASRWSLAPKNSVTDNAQEHNPTSQPVENNLSTQPEKTNDDYLFQFYLGSMTVVGLFVLFRMIQKSK